MAPFVVYIRSTTSVFWSTTIDTKLLHVSNESTDLSTSQLFEWSRCSYFLPYRFQAIFSHILIQATTNQINILSRKIISQGYMSYFSILYGRDLVSSLHF